MIRCGHRGGAGSRSSGSSRSRDKGATNCLVDFETYWSTKRLKQIVTEINGGSVAIAQLRASVTCKTVGSAHTSSNLAPATSRKYGP
ncbi:hypothetical protein GCM10023193_44760 [Planotetraspora kaengkrachanensis]|uniref:Uncharacterized protein n=1 Tax=Planotetraspora kaengkrachanensis TaxID=575193 RepID=A0A8J3PYD3_9ACTN|nr:hypothetical protein Pka01_64820 [Planotetraspora kaengkrachanensis]